ncbi:MAG: hypothetical protein VX464_20820 [Pseudomonadota bacterium]|nr:hypothetical protein [Pseudomonadota bacterium]
MSDTVIEQFFEDMGGMREASKRIGVPYTTLHGWKRHGRIPHWRLSDIQRAAAEKGVTVPAELLGKDAA